MAAETSLVGFLEEVMVAVRSESSRLLGELLREFGARPFGHEEADTLTQLGLYLDVCDDPAWWGAWLERQSALTGAAHAQTTAVWEAMRMERLLTVHGGPEAVRAALAMRDLGKAERALAQVDALDEQATITVRPPLAPPDALGGDLLALYHTPPPPPAPPAGLGMDALPVPAGIGG